MHPTPEAFLCPRIQLLEGRGLGFFHFTSQVPHILSSLEWELRTLFKNIKINPTPSLFRWGYHGPHSFGGIPKITQLLNCKAGTRTKAFCPHGELFLFYLTPREN